MTKNWKGYENTIGEVGRIWFDKGDKITELITTDCASTVLGYSERHIRNLCDSGKLIAIKVNGFWFVELSSIILFRERIWIKPDMP